MMYYFNTLPEHPRPRFLESLTGYLVRLAEVNQIYSVSGLSVLCFPANSRKNMHTWTDLPLESLGQLAEITNWNEGGLLSTTFHHLGAKFGRLRRDQWLGAFLNDSIASHLRYCPLCLAEHGYYSLTWRFTMLQGCPDHSCHLLECCGHCGSTLPVFASSLKIGICPVCGSNLAASATSRLNESERQHANECFHELAYLLTPQPWESGTIARALVQ